MTTSSSFKRGTKHWARIGGKQRSLGVSDNAAAEKICAFLDWCSANGREDVIRELSSGKLSAPPVYRAWSANQLDAFMREHFSPTVADVDVELEPLIKVWQAELKRRKKPNAKTAAKYEGQVRTLIVPGYRRSQLMASVLPGPGAINPIAQWLIDLDIEQPNRHRAALSTFCTFLVSREVIAFNPVAKVPSSKEAKPRTRHLSPEEALKLVIALPRPYRALHALMICTTAEVSPALGLRVRDINRAERTVFVKGTKGETRERTCRVYKRWLPVWKHVEQHLAELNGLPDAPMFPGCNYKDQLRLLHDAVAAFKWEEYLPKDHRHTWAVQALRDGLSIVTVQHQLGHVDPVMTLRVYANFLTPAASDFEIKVAPPVRLELVEEA